MYRTLIAALAAAELISTGAGAQLPANATTPAPNTRAARRMLNAQNCRVEFAMVRDVPLRVFVPNVPYDTSRPAGAATNVIAAGDTTAVNCFVTTFFSQYQPQTYYFQPQPVVMTAAPGAPAAPIAFVPRKIIMSSTSGGEVALPLKPSPDSGVIKTVKRPPR